MPDPITVIGRIEYMAVQDPRSPKVEATMAAVEWFSLLAFGGLVVAIAAVLAVNVAASPWWALLLLPLVPLGFLIADLVTGFGHYFADNFCSPDTPLIGGPLVFRFRQHHDDQLFICRLNFRELNGGLAGLALPWLGLGLGLALYGGLWATVAATLCLTSAFFMAGTNQIHRWAHEKAPNWVRFLQRHELILSPRRHAEHHRAPHDIHFCISCGWCNVFLDRIRFWHVLTDVLVFVGFPQAEESVMGTSRQRALAESGTSAAVRVSEA